MLPCGHAATTHLLQAGGIQLSFVYNLHRHLGRWEERRGCDERKKWQESEAVCPLHLFCKSALKRAGRADPRVSCEAAQDVHVS